MHVALFRNAICVRCAGVKRDDLLAKDACSVNKMAHEEEDGEKKSRVALGPHSLLLSEKGVSGGRKNTVVENHGKGGTKSTETPEELSGAEETFHNAINLKQYHSHLYLLLL